MAFLGRVSTEEQAEKGNIETQVEFAKKYFDLHGITDYKIYLDDGVSGTIALKDRPGASKLLEDIESGQVKAFYVYRLDRLARSVKHVLDTYELLESKNIPLVSMTESFDTGTPTGKFFMTLLASIAALERDTIQERTMGGKIRASREGRWYSGPAPFGYRVGANKKLEIYKIEADIVKMIFELYKEGMSTVDVAQYLNANNIPTPAMTKGNANLQTGKWNAGQISKILRAEVYAGTYTTMTRSKKDREPLTIEVPAIITKETFAEVNKLLTKNADVARGKKGRDYILRGLIHCLNCGRSYVGSSGDSKKGRVYYRCSGTRDDGSGKKCNAKMIRAVDLESVVWEDVQEFVSNPSALVAAVQDRIDKDQKDIVPVQNELNQVEMNISEKMQERQRVIGLVKKRLVTDKEAEIELNNLRAEIEFLEQRKQTLFERIAASQNVTNHAISALSILKNINLDNLDNEEKNKYIRVFVERINVLTTIDEKGNKDVKAHIKYRFSNTQKSCLDINVSRDA